MIIGLFLRHIKTYKGMHYVPVGNYNFINYLGKNGSGKSSIIEAFDSFFNGYREYSINKSAKKDGIYTKDNFPYFAPIFLIEKDKITKNKKEFELLSNFLWTVGKNEIASRVKPIANNFFKLRDKLEQDGHNKESHFLIILGETTGKRIYIPVFQKNEYFLAKIGYQKDVNEIKETNERNEENPDVDEAVNSYIHEKFKSVLEIIKKTYSYVYVPVEIDVENFTKIETNSMQKIFGKTLKNEIINAIDQNSIDKINNKLNDFVKEIENKLNGQYYYESVNTSKKYLTSIDLFEKILEVYFKIRVLNKGNSSNKKLAKKASELSAGEKRQALIDLLYAFLIEKQERDNYVVIGIDEPENSLHTGLCFEQFEKLKEISKNCQVFITTHWYGFLPIVSEGVGHFLNKNEAEEKIDFETYELYDYKTTVKKDMEENKNKIPHDFQLKSMNDLVHSIFYSIKQDKPYNWLICEGISEKIYFDYLFTDEIKNKNLRILPLGGQKEVIRLYKYLQVPIQYEASEFRGKIYCLIDTDFERPSDEIGDGKHNLQLRRLSNSNNGEGKTELITLKNCYNYATSIENALNPQIFAITMHNLTTDEKYQINEKIDLEKLSNTDFHESLKNFDLKTFFKENQGENKIRFADEYVKTLKNTTNQEKYIPDWIKKIKDFFA